MGHYKTPEIGNVIKYQTHVMLCLFIALVFAIIISWQKHVLIEGVYTVISFMLAVNSNRCRLENN